jgi:hypothetical protein
METSGKGVIVGKEAGLVLAAALFPQGAPSVDSE